MNCCFVMHEIFCLVITNLNLHTVEYLITRGIYTRCFNLSSFGQRKSTSCCGFMPFIKSTTCSGTGIFFVSLFFTKAKTGIPCLLVCDRFGFRLLCSVNPFLPRPIIYCCIISSIENNSVSQTITCFNLTHRYDGAFCGKFLWGLFISRRRSIARRRVIISPHRTCVCLTLHWQDFTVRIVQVRN